MTDMTPQGLGCSLPSPLAALCVAGSASSVRASVFGVFQIGVLGCVFMSLRTMRQSCFGMGAVVNGIQLVLTTCAVSQIFNGIIGWVPVKMSNFVAGRARTNECFGHQGVNWAQAIFGITKTKADHEVPLAIGVSSSDSGWNGKAPSSTVDECPANRPNSSKGRDFVSIRKFDYGQPYFHNQSVGVS